MDDLALPHHWPGQRRGCAKRPQTHNGGLVTSILPGHPGAWGFAHAGEAGGTHGGLFGASGAKPPKSSLHKRPKWTRVSKKFLLN